MCCQHDRESGSYVASDWVRASKYTDDTKAIEAGKTATDYIKDGAGGIQVGPNGSSNVTMTDEGLVFNGIRNLVPLWENADPTSGMAGGTVICSDGRRHLTQQLQLVVRNITQAHLIALRQKVA